MLALKTACIHPTTNQPYIKSSVGGIDMSIENLQVRTYGVGVSRSPGSCHHLSLVERGGQKNGTNSGLCADWVRPHNVQGGFSHAFVVEFETVEDRDHYVKKDEAHINFVKSLDGIVEAVRVMDFTPGSF